MLIFFDKTFVSHTVNLQRVNLHNDHQLNHQQNRFLALVQDQSPVLYQGMKCLNVYMTISILSDGYFFELYSHCCLGLSILTIYLELLSF